MFTETRLLSPHWTHTKSRKGGRSGKADGSSTVYHWCVAAAARLMNYATVA